METTDIPATTPATKESKTRKAEVIDDSFDQAEVDASYAAWQEDQEFHSVWQESATEFGEWKPPTSHAPGHDDALPEEQYEDGDDAGVEEDGYVYVHPLDASDMDLEKELDENTLEYCRSKAETFDQNKQLQVEYSAQWWHDHHSVCYWEACRKIEHSKLALAGPHSAVRQMHANAFPRHTQQRDEAWICLDLLQAATRMCGNDPGFPQFVITFHTKFAEVMPAWTHAKEEALAAEAAAAQDKAAQEEEALLIDLGTKDTKKSKKVQKYSRKVKKTKAKAKSAAKDKKEEEKECSEQESSEECSESAE